MISTALAAVVVLAVAAGIAQLRSIGQIVTRTATDETERAADRSMLPIAALIAAGMVAVLTSDKASAGPAGFLPAAGLVVAALVLPLFVRGRFGALLAVAALVAAVVVALGLTP